MKKYRIQSFFALKSFSFGLLIIMISYYAIVLFHLPNPIELIISKGLYGQAIVHYMTSFFILSILGASIKFGYILIGGWRTGIKPSLWQTFKSITFFLWGIGATLISIILLLRYIRSKFSAEYWHESHWFWVTLVLFVLFSFFYLTFKRWKLFTKEALDNLKAIPIVSPVFCFGGPFFFSKNLAFASLPKEQLNIYYIISISAGIVFMLFLILNAFLTSSDKVSNEDENKFILIDDSVKSKNDINQRLLSFNYLLLGLGIYLFLVLIIDMTITLII